MSINLKSALPHLSLIVPHLPFTQLHRIIYHPHHKFHPPQHLYFYFFDADALSYDADIITLKCGCNHL